jgi:type-F conjugative transfer system pilin chaperone TraQ
MAQLPAENSTLARAVRRAAEQGQPEGAFFLAELIAAILVLFGAYQVLDAWIARVSREEREALEARQQAMMAEQQEGGHVSH